MSDTMDASIATRTAKALVLHRADGAPIATTFRSAGLGRHDPFARQRDVAWEGPDAIAAGRGSFIGELDVASFPHTETLIVLKGELTLTAAGGEALVVGPNAGVVIAYGTRVGIHAASRAQFVWCAVECERPTRPGLTPLRVDAAFKPSASPPAETLLGPTPHCRNDIVFTGEDGRLRAGTWDSTAYHRVVRPHPLNEFMYLLAGTVRFANHDGTVLSAGAGDALFVPQGAAIGWESREHVAKFFVVQSVRA